MGTESKHAYRFGYLKSEKWKTVRLEAIARDGGLCQFCGKDVGAFADAHHVFYPKSFWDTKAKHLVALCRECHEYVHSHNLKSAKNLKQSTRAFLTLKDKASRERKEGELRLEKLNNPKCWVCRKPSCELSNFKSSHPKLVEFYPSVCPSCWIILTEKTTGSEHPFKIIKPLRAKKGLDAIK